MSSNKCFQYITCYPSLHSAYLSTDGTVKVLVLLDERLDVIAVDLVAGEEGLA